LTSPHKIEAELVPVWPEAGQRLGFRSRSATYDAIKKGYLPVVRFGRLMKVAEATIRRLTREQT
jgi:hypothetical protein